MELDEMKTVWTQHEKMLVAHTRLNKELIKKLLIGNAEKRIDWIRIRMLASLILSFAGIIFIAVPRIEFSLRFDVITGIILFVSLTIISYIWAIRVYLLLEKVNFKEPVLLVSKHLKRAEKYKLKIRRNGLILAPFMVIGIFLSAGIPFLSVKMIPFYALMVIVFLLSTYINARYGLVARIRKIDRDIEEIVNLEQQGCETV
jgi:hypothetical protein